MKNKLTEKVASMRNSDKRGMEILGWLATIVIGIAVVGIIWFFVRPAVNDTADDGAHEFKENSTAIFSSASENALSGTGEGNVPTSKYP